MLGLGGFTVKVLAFSETLNPIVITTKTTIINRSTYNNKHSNTTNNNKP